MGKRSPLPSQSPVVSSSLASNWFSVVTHLDPRRNETSDQVSLKRDRRDTGDSVVVLIRSDPRTEDDQPRFLLKGKQRSSGRSPITSHSWLYTTSSTSCAISMITEREVGQDDRTPLRSMKRPLTECAPFITMPSSLGQRMKRSITLSDLPAV